jgi:hypothetical protein
MRFLIVSNKYKIFFNLLKKAFPKKFCSIFSFSILIRYSMERISPYQNSPGHTEQSVYGSKWIKYGIFTALRRISFAKIRLRYIHVSITGVLCSRYLRALYATLVKVLMHEYFLSTHARKFHEYS